MGAAEQSAVAPTYIDLSSIAADGFVSADEVLFLRRKVFADGVVATDEVDALFELAGRAPAGDPEWSDFFAEAIADFYLREEDPNGYLTDAEFADLKTRADLAGNAGRTAVLHLFVRLMEKAVSTPGAMAAFTAQALRAHILEKTDAPHVGAADAALVRRYLFAAGGDGNVAVTQAEATLLFDVNDAVSGADNAPEWTDLFAKAISNHLMAHLGYVAPPRAQALQVSASLSGDADAATTFASVFDRIKAAFANPAKEVEARFAEQNAARAVAAADAEKITAEEADWLADRIGKDGRYDAAEQALIARMRELGAELPPRLRALVDAAG
ncbi:MAG: hypothetical protein AAGC56_09730 [Pseudomonadota bacterium]